MRIVLLSEVYCDARGYLENILPKYFARLGAETHVVASDLPPFYRVKSQDDSCRGFSEPLPAGTVQAQDGFTLHILGHRKVAGHMRMAGMGKKLASIRPDIVQTTATIGWIPLDAARLKLTLGYKFFTGSHYHASVFPLASKETSAWNAELLRCRVTRTLPGRLVSLFAEKCHAITPDCADVAVRFFGVPQTKIDICPLGVDTELFSPICTGQDRQARVELRHTLGFADPEIVTIYTGRFSEDKNPLLLAKAVARLANMGEPFRGLFVGNGEQAKAIQQCAGCVTYPFQPVQSLGNFYWAADVGVWPTQESMSMLDAAACGLPVVANDRMAAPERLEGNGLSYKMNDLDDLVRVMLEFRNPEVRQRMGALGARKMALEFSWESVAKRRLRDYQAALDSKQTFKKKPVSTDLLERLD
jgi:glycosyltransferase involved in cell wall biosynthesis